MLKFIAWNGVHALLGLVLVSPSPSWAQGVYKCTVDGKSSYQSLPCAGPGKVIQLSPGPSEQQIHDAKVRAEAEKVGLVSPAIPAQQGTPNQATTAQVDCASLNKERADAFGRRNATVAGNRRAEAMGKERGILVIKPELIAAESKAVDQENANIRRIESQMAKNGCTPS